MRIEIHKFGGTSVGSAERLAAAAALIDDAAERASIVAVSSAMSGVTNELIRIADAAASGDRSAALEAVAALAARHDEALSALATGEGVDPEPVRAELAVLFEELSDLIRATVVLGELTLRSRDRLLATGEKLAVRLLVTALAARGRQAVGIDADTFLETDDRFGSADPIGGIADRHVASALTPVLERGAVAVVTGFCGRAPDGATTTLGRGGSDLSATLIAAALAADEVTIWTDVDGVFTADPRAVPSARVIEHLNYREAAEMSYYGAKVLHQRTMIPVARAKIPVLTRNSFDASAPGTVVDGRFTPGSHPVKAITAVRDQALVSVEGKGMAGVPGVAAAVFGALAQAGISVTMISQSSSESSICLAVPASDALDAERALKAALATPMSRGDIEEIVVRPGVGLVAAVGLGMAQTPGVAARAFGALAQRGVNVLAIAQGSSELNLSLAVQGHDVPAALRAIHDAFGLDRRDTGEEAGGRLDLLLLGCGQIGRALVRLITTDRAEAFARLGLRPRIVAVADRSGFVLAPSGLSAADTGALLAEKARGAPLAERPDGVRGSAGDMVRAALGWRLSRPILIDVSDADDAHEAALAALSLGVDLATANKRPLAGARQRFEALTSTAREHDRVLRAEATVGAGLPIIDTLQVMIQTGDVVHGVEGSLSGTLGFVMSRLEAGLPLSSAVREAMEAGYTEPDPVQDLSGADVARKAVILARWAGLPEGEVALTGLVPAGWAGTDPDVLLARLADELDAPMAERIAAAEQRGCVLRFVARIAPGAITVGPTEVPRDAALGRLSGTDNLVLFRTERYADRPLVVTGPGAGIDVTAMGVLGDVLRIAAIRS